LAFYGSKTRQTGAITRCHVDIGLAAREETKVKLGHKVVVEVFTQRQSPPGI
jgi:hypothetical protein